MCKLPGQEDERASSSWRTALLVRSSGRWWSSWFLPIKAKKYVSSQVVSPGAPTALGGTDPTDARDAGQVDVAGGSQEERGQEPPRPAESQLLDCLHLPFCVPVLLLNKPHFCYSVVDVTNSFLPPPVASNRKL